MSKFHSGERGMWSGSAATMMMTKESEGEEEKWQTRRGCWRRKVRRAAAAAWVEETDKCRRRSRPVREEVKGSVR